MQHAIECSLKAFLCRRSSSGVYVRETPQMEESTTVFAPVVSQEACEQFLLNSTAFVAYSSLATNSRILRAWKTCYLGQPQEKRKV